VSYARADDSSTAGRVCAFFAAFRAVALWFANVVAHRRHLSAIRFQDTLLSGSRAARAARSQSAACFQKSSGRFMRRSSALWSYGLLGPGLSLLIDQAGRDTLAAMRRRQGLFGDHEDVERLKRFDHVGYPGRDWADVFPGQT
jgi:hypothetical protein